MASSIIPIRCAVTFNASHFASKPLQEDEIMSFESAYKEQGRDELLFTSELGWLGLVSFAVIAVIASLNMT